jgi:hypothetical protein
MAGKINFLQCNRQDLLLVGHQCGSDLAVGTAQRDGDGNLKFLISTKNLWERACVARGFIPVGLRSGPKTIQ